MEKPKRLVLRVGEELPLVLPANPTTGYRWEALVDRSGLRVKDSGFHAAGSGLGRGGKQEFAITAVAEGEYRVRLIYKRPWEATSAKEDLYIVTATPAA